MNYLDDLKLLQEAALKVGPLIMNYFGTDMVVETKAHAGFSPVTIADKEADQFLHDFLTAARPNYGWLSEEIEDNTDRLDKECVFIVDPIDGTKPFIKGEPEFTVSIAIVRNGKPIVGVVYNPAKKQMYAGAKGEGLTFNGEKVNANAGVKSLKEQECLVSQSEMNRGLWVPYEGEFSMKPIGSIAYKLAIVAAGQSDFMVTLCPKSEWDCAAGHVLCVEAGLKVTNIFGECISYNNEMPDGTVDRMIVASPLVYKELKDLLDLHV
ncbi:MAG: myo-inositol-1(or 4)-monophosphatase [Alphaproteobacteria bacterium]|jgi:myo-inositol-1(or 4)-monophosphatase